MSSIFSTYSQGENRVTSSMLAVFEQLGTQRLARLLDVAVGGEPGLQLVRFKNQSARGDASGVPDAQIAGSFDLLFETKTVPGAVGLDQLKRHLGHFGGAATERLYVVTPDAAEPAEIARTEDDRTRWFNFVALSDAIDGLLEDALEVVSERDAFMLRQLQTFFADEGLLSSPENVVVVAASRAISEYEQHSAYICQQGRSFRQVDYMGFYVSKEIRAVVPRILHRRDDIEFTQEFALYLDEHEEPFDREVAALIRGTLAGGTRPVGDVQQVFLLSAPDSPDTLNLKAAVRHTGRGAWVQGQRYVSSESLEAATTTDEL